MVDNNCIIEGNVKFRDGKKWKSRWCVMRKLSPVADCMHLQLYGDSKDRYKQGQTKASLSLQHFLGVQSGFTLDKESNTIAIICQDVTVVLAFDTRERLIQWQVKISNNLGEDQEFLVLISSAPAKAKLSNGPAQLHVREQRFCMTLGVPPRLVGTWEIGQLRRYGVVEGRFCFEGGSRCGRGEGLHVLISDQAEEIARALQLAAEGKLPAGRKRPLGLPAALHDSPRRQQQQLQFSSRSETRASDFFPSAAAYVSSLGLCDEACDPEGLKADAASSSYWSSAESRQEPDSASLVSELTTAEQQQQQQQADWRSCSLSRQHASAACLERCSSCISKLGTMSKSSTCATNATSASGSSPAPQFPGSLAALGNLAHLQPRAFDRLSLSSYSSSSHDSDYSSSPQPKPGQPVLLLQQQQQQQQAQQPPSGRPSPSPGLALPPRPPKPSTAPKKKPPMPLPLEQICTCTKKTTPTRPNGAGPYENYDIPKTIPVQQPQSQQQQASLDQLQSPQADLNYDTPRKIKECLAIPAAKAYPNYDTPHAPQAVVLQQCGCPAKLTPQQQQQTPKSLVGCPCQNVMSWAGFVLPYCRRGAGIEPTGVTVQPVRLSGEGKMPVVNACGQLTIYNSPNSSSSSSNSTASCQLMETSQSSSNSNNDCECPVHSSESCYPKANYENIEPQVIDTQPEPKANYANIDFTESLGNYENSKNLLTKVVNGSREIDVKSAEKSKNQAEGEDKSVEEEDEEEETTVCHKCGHPKEASQPDYLVLDEDNDLPKKQQQHPGYLPMQPAHNACSKEVLSRLCSGPKSSSNPALSGVSPLEASRKRSESEYRVPGSAMLSSPYFRRRLLDMSNSEFLRKRSYSAESAHYLDDDKSSFTASAQIHKCPSDSEKTLANHNNSNNEVAADSETETNDSPEAASSSLSPQPLASIKIRRSSSVPSKTGHNRDSSSSNDSGVSTGSLSHRTGEFGEFADFPVTPANTLIKKQSVPLMYRKSPPPACYHSSLPRKSKSSDPIKEITFQFHKVKLPAKSSSAEADIPTCLPSKVSKEFSSPSEVTSVPYNDSRSTSSGTSDMSDYIETLSLSSHSSSDAPDNLRIGGRAVATTLRPRSGKEYYKIDRSILVEQGRTLSTSSSNYANIAPFTRKETPRHPVT